MPRVDLIQMRAGTAALWTSVNPVLAAGEPGLETDTGKEKRGDGATAWVSLAYTTDVSRLPSSVATASAKPKQAPGLRWAINVQDGKYGAVGDGVADDTAAVLAAQADAQATQGRPLYFPAGKYRLTQQFSLQKGEIWLGDHWSNDSAGSLGSVLSFALSSPAACFVAKTPTAFTDNVTFQDLVINGDGVHTTNLFFLQSCRFFKFQRVYMATSVQEVVWFYGQRDCEGLINSGLGLPGDCTHNTFRDCVFVNHDSSGLYDVVRLGGTLLNVTIAHGAASNVTITSDSGATITVSDGTQILGSAGTIVCADNGEWINFTGKSGNNLTGCTRAIHGTTQIVHPNGTQFAVRRAMGVSNMNTFSQCVFSGPTPANRHGLWIEAGSINTFNETCAFTGNGGDGVHISWYGNSFDGCVSETNSGWGFKFDDAFDAHDNHVAAQWNGGGNTLGFALDQGGGNHIDAVATGIKLPNNVANGITGILNGALYGFTDGLARYRDAQGIDRPAFGVRSFECPATSITAGTVTRFRALNLTRTPWSTAATLDIWDVEAVSNAGGVGGYTIDVYDETDGATLTTPAFTSHTPSSSGGSLAGATYAAKLTAVNAFGETVASAEVTDVVTGPSGSVVYNWSAVTGATSYKLYVGNTGAGSENQFFSVGNVTTFTLTTLTGTSSGLPPSIDRSGNLYSFTGAFNKGNPLASISGIGNKRLSIRLWNPTTGSVIVTGHITFSIRNV